MTQFYDTQMRDVEPVLKRRSKQASLCWAKQPLQVQRIVRDSQHRPPKTAMLNGTVETFSLHAQNALA